MGIPCYNPSNQTTCILRYRYMANQITCVYYTLRDRYMANQITCVSYTLRDRDMVSCVRADTNSLEIVFSSVADLFLSMAVPESTCMTIFI